MITCLAYFLSPCIVELIVRYLSIVIAEWIIDEFLFVVMLLFSLFSSTSFTYVSLLCYSLFFAIRFYELWKEKTIFWRFSINFLLFICFASISN